MYFNFEKQNNRFIFVWGLAKNQYVFQKQLERKTYFLQFIDCFNLQKTESINDQYATFIHNAIIIILLIFQ